MSSTQSRNELLQALNLEFRAVSANSVMFSQTVADKGRVNEIRIEFDDPGAGRELGLQCARFVGLVRQVF